MKKLILSLIGLSFIGCVSMVDIKPIDTNKQFQKTIENIDLSKSEIFNKTWIQLLSATQRLVVEKAEPL